MNLQLQTGTSNQILRNISKPVKKITKEHQELVQKMIETMELEKGVGLAAPQVGKNIRLIVCKFEPGTEHEWILPMINPELLKCSDTKVYGEEGCLSVPGFWGKVERADHIFVRFQSLEGTFHTMELWDFNARIFLHELDHLNGILFTDLAKDVKEAVAKRKK